MTIKFLNKPIIAASLLNCNFLKLENSLDELKKANIKWIHYDVMDYHFVSNLSFGPKILNDISKKYDFYYDCHMMVKIDPKTNLENYLKPFIKAKANSFTFHYEALIDKQILDLINLKAKYNIKIGLAISPDTKVSVLKPYLNNLDLVLIMSVYPGFGAQKFIKGSILKVKELKQLLVDFNKSDLLIEIDGGISADSIKLCKNLPISIFVVGSYLFKSKNIVSQIKKLNLNE